jgi:hypothetical protein
MKTRTLTVALMLAAGAVTTAAQADVIVDWNQELLGAIAATNMAPPRAARAMAMVHTAQFEAVNSIDRNFRNYRQYFDCPTGTSKEAAAAQAAAGVMLELFPTRAAQINARLSTHLGGIADGTTKVDGITLGVQAASAMLSHRSTDNSSNSVSFTNGTQPGQWRTVPASASAILPHWGSVRPFVVNSSSQFSSPAVPALTSAAYATAYNEVKELGRVDSATRTQYQTDTAYLWRAGGNTVTPPGQWNEVAQQVAAGRNLNIEQSSRMFALLGLAVADAGVTAWETKYTQLFWRPETGIQLGDTDGNAQTIGESNWTPLFATPNHPSYTSGHSTFSSAAAAILRNFIGGDSFTFTVTGDGRSRQYTNFTDAMNEAGMSRVYGGIHWQFDNQMGLAAGSALGDWVFGNALAVPTPGALGTLAVTALFAARRRRA